MSRWSLLLGVVVDALGRRWVRCPSSFRDTTSQYLHDALYGFPRKPMPETEFPRRTLLRSPLNKRAFIRLDTVRVYASVQNWFPRRVLLSSLVNRGKAAPGLL